MRPAAAPCCLVGRGGVTAVESDVIASAPALDRGCWALLGGFATVADQSDQWRSMDFRLRPGGPRAIQDAVRAVHGLDYGDLRPAHAVDPPSSVRPAAVVIESPASWDDSPECVKSARAASAWRSRVEVSIWSACGEHDTWRPPPPTSGPRREAFQQIDPDYIVPSHCRPIPQKLVMPSTGTRVIFGARPSSGGTSEAASGQVHEV